MIELRDVSFAYENSPPVLDGVNWSIDPGARIVLRGESGLGKTTLLYLLAGLLRPQQGTITGLPEDGASVVFQEDRLLGHLTILDNLRLVAPAQPIAALKELLARVGLAGEENHLPEQLSGGMRRRVAILRSLVFPRSLYLMDEPFQGLDPDTHQVMADCVGNLTQGSTVIVISHHPEDAKLLDAQEIQLKSLMNTKKRQP